jgi:hypothetical protein
MKKYLVYSVIIYIILFYILINKKHQYFYDNKSNCIKSWNYICNKFNNYDTLDDFISIPLFVFLIAIFSYLLACKIK